MATGKRYYWLKLKESFMTSDTVDFLMSQKDGANYVVLYQMLCLKTINTEGRFSRTIGEIVIPYDVNKIQRDCKWFTVDTIRVALELYKRFGLVYEEQDGTLVITDHRNLVGSETDWAQQKRDQTIAKQNVPRIGSGNEAESPVESGVENLHTDIRDKILDIRDKENRDEDIERKDTNEEKGCGGKERKPKRERKAFVKPTVEEVAAYCKERNNGIDPEAFIAHYESNGWMVGKNPMQNWKMAIVTWEKNHLGANGSKKNDSIGRKSHYKPDGSYDYEAGQSRELESF